MKLRREDPVFSAQRSDWIQGTVLGPEAFLLRFFGRPHSDRLLVVNLGRTLKLRPGPEPLLAAPEGTQWKILWSSEDPRYERKRGDGDSPLPLGEGRVRVQDSANLVTLTRRAESAPGSPRGRACLADSPDFPSTIPGHCALVMYEGSGD